MDGMQFADEDAQRPRRSVLPRSRRATPKADVRAGRARSRGQSLVEFSMMLPLVLLLILFGVDFARVFSGWLTLTNAVREAANFAAINPDAWLSPGSPTARAEYARLINAEAAAINCTLPSPLPNPSFPGGRTLGSPTVVSVTCRFSLITPVISSILGNRVNVTASASFPVRSGSIKGVPTSGTSLPTPGPTPSPTPTPDPSATAVPTATPAVNCSVPDLVQGSLKTDGAVLVWTAAGFTSTNLIFDPLVPPQYDIKYQSLTPGASVLCTSGMTVSDKRP